jgi:hypothetical protein
MHIHTHKYTQEPWKKLTSMDKVVSMDQTEDVRKAYDGLMAQMNEYQKEQVCVCACVCVRVCVCVSVCFHV